MECRFPLDFPLNWELKLGFSVLPDRPTPCMIKDGRWMRLLEINGKTTPVVVECSRNIENPVLLIKTSDVSAEEKKEIKRIIFEFHGLRDADSLYRFMENDRVLREIREKLHGFGRAGLMSTTVFEGIIKAIIQQQISLKVAEHITANLVERYGKKLEFCGDTIYGFPDSGRLTALNTEQLRRCGLSSRKAEYIREFSLSVENGLDPESLRKKEVDEIIDILTAFKGIGRWTAELVMVASMGLNVIPADDLGVRKAISYFYFNNRLQSAETIRKFAEEKFGKFKRDCIVYLLMAYRSRI